MFHQNKVSGRMLVRLWYTAARAMCWVYTDWARFTIQAKICMWQSRDVTHTVVFATNRVVSTFKSTLMIWWCAPGLMVVWFSGNVMFKRDQNFASSLIQKHCYYPHAWLCLQGLRCAVTCTVTHCCTGEYDESHLQYARRLSVSGEFNKWLVQL